MLRNSKSLLVGAIGVVGFTGLSLSINIAPAQGSTFSYAVEEVPFAYDNISAVGTREIGNLDDAPTVLIDLGFTFNFYGTDYSQISWNPNGLITFSGRTFEYQNVDLTTTTAPDSGNDIPLIAVLWDDWTFEDEATTDYYFSTGTPGDRRFTVQWDAEYLADVGVKQCSLLVDNQRICSFQATLFEGSNNILFSYLDVDTDSPGAFGASATVGVRNTQGHITGEVTQYSFNEPVIFNQTSLLFRPISEPESVPEPGLLLGIFAIAGATLAIKQSEDSRDSL
jgi:hypothetical protein